MRLMVAEEQFRAQVIVFVLGFRVQDFCFRIQVAIPLRVPSGRRR